MENSTEETEKQDDKPELVIEEAPVEEVTDLVVVASNPQQMQVAQQQLITWTEAKITQAASQHKELLENLKIAKKNKWRTATLRKAVCQAKEEVEYHKKVKTALEAGYVIIPNFEEIDIFAIRTRKTRPKRTGVSQRDWGSTPVLVAQESDRAPAGEGRYVDADTKNRVYRWKDTKGETSTQMVSVTPSAFRDVGFPFQLAKPEILEKTGQAMKMLVFDDVGIVPGRKKSRRGDPMVIGRILLKKKSMKAVSFLITWFVNTRDL